MLSSWYAFGTYCERGALRKQACTDRLVSVLFQHSRNLFSFRKQHHSQEEVQDTHLDGIRMPYELCFIAAPIDAESSFAARKKPAVARQDAYPERGVRSWY